MQQAIKDLQNNLTKLQENHHQCINSSNYQWNMGLIKEIVCGFSVVLTSLGEIVPNVTAKAVIIPLAAAAGFACKEIPDNKSKDQCS